MKYDMKILTDGCENFGIHLSEEQLEQFILYYEALIEKNRVMNLTAITEFEEVLVKHFLDSLSVVKGIDMFRVNRMLDLGTGAGFPGIPLKIAFPEIEILLLDSLNKRINFLNKIIEKCRFNKITAVHGRAEELAKKNEYREKFDLCVSRAVANLSSLSEYCIPYVKTGGKFISYKSGNVDIELQNAKKAIHILGGGGTKKVCFLLPNSDIERSLIIVDKERTTPMKYPRKAGLPAKEPL